jgi:hypothetical protein
MTTDTLQSWLQRPAVLPLDGAMACLRAGPADRPTLRDRRLRPRVDDSAWVEARVNAQAEEISGRIAAKLVAVLEAKPVPKPPRKSRAAKTTQAEIGRRIKAAQKAGLVVTGMAADGTLQFGVSVAPATANHLDRELAAFEARHAR